LCFTPPPAMQVGSKNDTPTRFDRVNSGFSPHMLAGRGGWTTNAIK
jgi:hypothetical protein